MKHQKMPNFITDIIKHHYIDNSKFDLIIDNSYFLSDYDFIAVCLIQFEKEVSKIHFFNGMLSYFSNIKSHKADFPFNSKVLLDFKNQGKKFNNKYDNAFISIVEIKDDFFYLEHNIKFSEEEKIEVKEVTKLIEQMIKDRNTNV